MITTPTRPVFEAPSQTPPRPGTIRFVDVPERRCLMISGAGNPDGPEFQTAIGALYSVAYGLKFGLKHRGVDSRVGCLEGLWTRTGESSHVPLTEAADPADWAWTLLIELPEAAREADIRAAIEAARERKPNPHLDGIRVDTFLEGPVVETLHIGPYAAEPETIRRMQEAAEDADLRIVGPHHEIYLGDPSRSSPERLKTLLRLPVG